MDETAERQSVVYTVGHSNHTLVVFLDLLQRYAIDVLVDTRSRPHSTYVPHFNHDMLNPDQTARVRLACTAWKRRLGGYARAARWRNPRLPRRPRDVCNLARACQRARAPVHPPACDRHRNSPRLRGRSRFVDRALARERTPHRHAERDLYDARSDHYCNRRNRRLSRKHHVDWKRLDHVAVARVRCSRSHPKATHRL